MNWKTSLDKYLTTPPDDGFDRWAEQVVNNFTDEFYTENEDWINDTSGECTEWLNELFYGGYEIEQAAYTIQARKR